MAYTGPFGWSATGSVSGLVRDPNNPSQFFFQDQSGKFIGNPFDQATANRYFGSGRPLLGSVDENGNFVSSSSSLTSSFEPGSSIPGAGAQMPVANHVNNYIPGAGAQMPSVPKVKPGFSPVRSGVNPMVESGILGQLEVGSGVNPMVESGAPFLTNSTISGIGAATQPFDSSWYDRLGQSLFGQANRNLLENVLPAIQQSGQSAGQYGGGSRAEIAKGIAMRGMNEGVFNALAPLYAQGYESNLNRNLQGGQTALQGLLGLGGLDIGRMNAETAAASAMANAAGAPQYSNPLASGLGAMFSMLPLLWGK